MCVYIYIYIYIYMYIYIVSLFSTLGRNCSRTVFTSSCANWFVIVLHSAKGGAVETWCSDLYDAIY